eukprot:scaffold6313_cov67-Skeletonema_dohrnii-CCMP3373.AAC.1
MRLMPSIPLAITALLEQRHGRLPAYRLVHSTVMMTGNHWWNQPAFASGKPDHHLFRPAKISMLS